MIYYSFILLLIPISLSLGKIKHQQAGFFPITSQFSKIRTDFLQSALILQKQYQLYIINLYTFNTQTILIDYQFIDFRVSWNANKILIIKAGGGLMIYDSNGQFLKLLPTTSTITHLEQNNKYIFLHYKTAIDIYQLKQGQYFPFQFIISDAFDKIKSIKISQKYKTKLILSYNNQPCQKYIKDQIGFFVLSPNDNQKVIDKNIEKQQIKTKILHNLNQLSSICSVFKQNSTTFQEMSISSNDKYLTIAYKQQIQQYQIDNDYNDTYCYYLGSIKLNSSFYDIQISLTGTSVVVLTSTNVTKIMICAVTCQSCSTLSQCADYNGKSNLNLIWIFGGIIICIVILFVLLVGVAIYTRIKFLLNDTINIEILKNYQIKQFLNSSQSICKICHVTNSQKYYFRCLQNSYQKTHINCLIKINIQKDTKCKLCQVTVSEKHYQLKQDCNFNSITLIDKAAFKYVKYKKF